MSSGAVKAAGPRRRRPSAQTRALLLETAAQLVLERLSSDGDVGNLLAAVRVTDVLDAINTRARAAGEHEMTTGAVYQIWSTQEAFQSELLGHITYHAANRDLGAFRDQIASSITLKLPFDQVVLRAGESLLTWHAGSPEVSLAIGLAALVSPQRVRTSEDESNAEYLATLGELLSELGGFGRRELAPGLEIRDLVWAVEALADGVDLRVRSHPEMVEHTDEQGSSAPAMAFLGVVKALTVPRPRKPPGR